MLNEDKHKTEVQATSVLTFTSIQSDFQCDRTMITAQYL
jgi:hypothetical protein